MNETKDGIAAELKGVTTAEAAECLRELQMMKLPAIHKEALAVASALLEAAAVMPAQLGRGKTVELPCLPDDTVWIWASGEIRKATVKAVSWMCVKGRKDWCRALIEFQAPDFLRGDGILRTFSEFASIGGPGGDRFTAYLTREEAEKEMREWL